jgi:carboxyl-terminal processing protease
MTSTLDKTLRTILLILIAALGAAFFYLAGLGTGMYVAQAAIDPRSLPAMAEPDQPPSAVPSDTPALPPLTTPTGSTELSEGEGGSLDIFWEAWHILEGEFYGDLPPESDLPYAAIRGVIAATGDQYTAFLDPVQAQILQTDLSGSFEGIGATVRLRPDGKLEIVQPLAGWPAMKAGLRPKDAILEVDDVKIQGMSLYEAISLIRGPAGTSVRLLVEREEVAEPFEVEIERAHIELPMVESRMLDQDIAYIRLTEFGETATEELKSALRDLLDQNPQGLIFDLRGNRGGYLSTSIEVTSQFVTKGPIVIERFKDGREDVHEAIPGGLAPDIPLVLLVNGASASASEITAGAIQDTGRGILIGTTTLGKGSVQVAHRLSDDSQLRVTIARWFTPKGRAIHGEGLEPDIEVTVDQEDMTADQDPQLERAISYLLEGS